MAFQSGCTNCPHLMNAQCMPLKIISLITMDSYALAPSSVLLAPGVPRPRNSPRLTCEGQGAGQVDQGNVIAVLLAVGVSKGEIAPVVDYCLHPQLHAMG